MDCPTLLDACEILLIVILPPIGVLTAGLQKKVNKTQLCGDVLVNSILTFIFYPIGSIHGLCLFPGYRMIEENQVMGAAVDIPPERPQPRPQPRPPHSPPNQSPIRPKVRSNLVPPTPPPTPEPGVPKPIDKTAPPEEA